ncbi:uncharacterized protein [Montipora foliosa]|uniref:uncharacterized protein isoform X2 n=1 Tax=Montipora foliosa TaxID=591990 RepID=UPI0035F1B093
MDDKFLHMRLQSHEDMRPVLVIRYRPSQHAIAVLRLIMQSEECTKVLKHLNIHVALVGSNFDDDAIGKQPKKGGDTKDIELRILHPTMSPRQLVIGNILSGSDRNLITSLVSSAEVACQAANALASHRALIQEERELKRKQDEDFRLSEFQDRQRQCQEASNEPENKESEDDESEHSTIVDNIELRQKRIAAFCEQGEPSKRPRHNPFDGNSTLEDSGTVTFPGSNRDYSPAQCQSKSNNNNTD